MKNFFRITALCLSFVLLVSCSVAPELLSFIPETGNDGFGGYEFVIKGNWPKFWDPNAEDGNEVESGALDLWSDSLIAHNANIMEKFDCKITAIYMDWAWSESMMLDVVAETVDYDLMDTNANLMVENIKSGYVLPWEYSGIDLSDHEKYGEQSFLDASAYNGYHYGIWSNKWQANQQFRGVMAVNNDLLSNFAIGSTFELYENGMWTFDEFKKILDLFATDERYIPMIYYDDKMLATCSLMANGSNLVNFDEATGKYYYGLLDEAAMTALEYVKTLVDEGLAVADNTGNYFIVEQNTPFFLAESWQIEGNIDNMDTICYPFGPDGEYGVDISSYRSTNQRYVYMPVTADASFNGRFIEIWFEELEGYSKSTIVDDLKVNNFYNDESFDMWMNLSENAKYDYGFELDSIYDMFHSQMSEYIFNGRSVVEFIQSQENRVQSCIDENLNN